MEKNKKIHAPYVLTECELESIINERVIEELEKYKSMMEEVRDGRRNHSFNDFIVGFGRTIEGLKQ
jgi:hypothetical protein|tara:strand:- start:329 stop:526 length:198 start_codon:yes stop_codon:yes gene_type:complete